jgi:hypothetical protein
LGLSRRSIKKLDDRRDVLGFSAALKRRSFTVMLAAADVPSIQVKIKIKGKVRGKVKGKVKGEGQECPSPHEQQQRQQRRALPAWTLRLRLGQAIEGGRPYINLG